MSSLMKQTDILYWDTTPPLWNSNQNAQPESNHKEMFDKTQIEGHPTKLLACHEKVVKEFEELFQIKGN